MASLDATGSFQRSHPLLANRMGSRCGHAPCTTRAGSRTLHVVRLARRVMKLSQRKSVSSGITTGTKEIRKGMVPCETCENLCHWLSFDFIGVFPKLSCLP